MVTAGRCANPFKDGYVSRRCDVVRLLNIEPRLDRLLNTRVKEAASAVSEELHVNALGAALIVEVHERPVYFPKGAFMLIAVVQTDPYLVHVPIGTYIYWHMTPCHGVLRVSNAHQPLAPSKPSNLR